MKSWRFGFAIAAAFVFGITITVLAGAVRIQKGKSPAEYQASLSEQMPVGTDKREVISQLDNARMEHSDYLSERRVILAIVRHSCWSLVFECSVDIELHFDESGKLTSISAKEGFTSL